MNRQLRQQLGFRKPIMSELGSKAEVMVGQGGVRFTFEC